VKLDSIIVWSPVQLQPPHPRREAGVGHQHAIAGVDPRRVILNGAVSSSRAKRAAGDDAWDTPGVTDVSNQLQVTGDAGRAA
jgi:hypothetical protein